jgi:Cys-tRNA synthase (O-phospho-L-seryl-tRNA:Cys-tRNA synthase)|tara:strand:- start:261 stop:470 length:210 start_codon:yes stop_codon:yes gene_type:complete
MNYLDDIDENFVDLVYLTSMQMGIVNTIADLPTREERKKAWDELPEHTRSMKGMKDMVYHRVVRKFRST